MHLNFLELAVLDEVLREQNQRLEHCIKLVVLLIRLQTSLRSQVAHLTGPSLFLGPELLPNFNDFCRRKMEGAKVDEVDCVEVRLRLNRYFQTLFKNIECSLKRVSVL